MNKLCDVIDSFSNKVLLLIPDDELRNTIAADMSGLNGSVERWNMMNKRINEFFKRGNKSTKTSVNILKEIMLQVDRFFTMLCCIFNMT